MKKIALLNTNMEWGASERWLLYTGDYLKKHGFAPVFICSPSSKLAHDAKRFGHDVTSIEHSRFSFIRNMGKSRLEQELAKVHAVIINFEPDLRAGVLAAEAAGVKKIIYRADSPEPLKNSALNKKLYGKIHHVLAASREVARNIVKHTGMWFPEEKITLLYHGLDPDKLNLSKERYYHPKEGEVSLGYAGRLVEEKGHRDLLRVAKLLKEQDFKFHLLVAGYGELENELKAQAVKLGLEDEVEYLGYVKNMPKFYNSIDYFVFPSHAEGSPETLIEAMAHKKICFAYDTSSMPEVIDYTNGYLSPPGDAGDMAYKIARHGGGNLGDNARQTVEEKFNYQKNMQKLLDILD